MKKYLFITVFAAIFGLSACNDYLDVKPTDFGLTKDYYQTPEQVNYALTAIYSLLKSTVGSETFIRLAYGSSDECYYYSPTPGPPTWQNESDNTDISSIWANSYTAINYCNNLLENIDNAKDLDPEVKNRAIGEALFLRGFYHFLLAQWWGDVPMYTKATTSFLDGVRERTPVKLVYDQIIADMTKADSLLAKQTLASLGYPERVTRNTVQAMLTRVCLYAAGDPVNDKSRYADALKWSSSLKAMNYHILNPNYAQIFINLAEDKFDIKETIWELGFNYISLTSTLNSAGPVGNYGGIGNTYSVAVGGALRYVGYCFGYHYIHPRLYFAYKDGDRRRDRNIGNYKFTGNVKYPLTSTQIWERLSAKFRREEETAESRINNQRGTAINWPIIRYADVLLMLAEAENEVNGPTAVAYDAVNQVRRRGISSSRIVDRIDATNVGSGYTYTPSLTITGGGGSGAMGSLYNNAGKISVILENQGSGYISAPTIIIGDQWVANTPYNVGIQVAVGGKLYTVTTAGTSTSTAPTNTTGASAAATTGAVFTYVGVPAIATAVISAQPIVDMTPGLSKEDFRKAIQEERYRELAYEGVRIGDLRRWGILVSTIKGMANDVNGNTPGIPGTTSTTYAPNALLPTNAISQRDIFWPIPLRDLLTNPKLKQNPGF